MSQSPSDQILSTGLIPPISSTQISIGGNAVTGVFDNSGQAYGVTNLNSAIAADTPSNSLFSNGTLANIFGGFSTLFSDQNSPGSAANIAVSAAQAALGTSNAPGANTGKSSFWTDIFLRGVIIILGFIFVATGLSMFKEGKG